VSVEQAIIELVVQGAGTFEQTNEKIKADLTSTERAGRQAEEATGAAARGARSAEQAAQRLTNQVGFVLSKLNTAVNLAQKTASALGADRDSVVGQGLDAIQGGIALGAQGFKLGALTGQPEIAVLAGVAASIVGVVSSLQETEKRLSSQTQRLEQDRPNEITEAFLREAGLAKFDQAIAGGRRLVQ